MGWLSLLPKKLITDSEYYMSNIFYFLQLTPSNFLRWDGTLTSQIISLLHLLAIHNNSFFSFLCQPPKNYVFIYAQTAATASALLLAICVVSFFFLFQRRWQEFWWWGYRPLGKFLCLPALFSGSVGLVSSHFVFLLFSLNKFYMWPLGKLRPTSGSALDSEYYC